MKRPSGFVLQKRACIFLREERPAGDIAARFDLTGATVSYHLAQLKKAGLVAETRRGPICIIS